MKLPPSIGLSVLVFLACNADEDHRQLRSRLSSFQTSGNSTTTPPACPVPADGVCTREYMPVQCGVSNCVYANQCLATLAGFSPDDCESVDRTKSCPVGEGAPCIEIYMPVSCGPDACVYGNQCLADLAGFESTECQSA